MNTIREDEQGYSDGDIVSRLRARAIMARSEETATALGDALHFEEAAIEIEHLTALNADAHAIVNRIWAIFRSPSYEILAGQTIYDLVQTAFDDAARYRHLRDHCSSHYPMTHEQPAEWSIGWEFQQSKPHEAYGSFDKWIDADIAAHAERQAEIDAEDAADNCSTCLGAGEIDERVGGHPLSSAASPCPDCGGSGVIVKRVTVYEPGCGFGHDDGEEVPCPECSGPDPDHLRDLRDEDRRLEKEYPDVD